MNYITMNKFVLEVVSEEKNDISHNLYFLKV